MVSVKYILVFACIFLAVFAGDVWAGEFNIYGYTLNIITDNNDKITHAMHEELFNATTNVYGSCPGGDACTFHTVLYTAHYDLTQNIVYDIRNSTVDCISGPRTEGLINISKYHVNEIDEGVNFIMCEIYVNPGSTFNVDVDTTFYATPKYFANNQLNKRWYSKLFGSSYYEYYDSTSILAPYIKMTGNGTASGYDSIPPIYVYAGDWVRFGHTFENIDDSWHFGTAFNVTTEITYNETAFDIDYCSFPFQYGDIPSGISRYNDCTYNATHTGTYDFSVFVFDNSTLYNDTAVSTVTVVNLTINGSVDDINVWEMAHIYATVKGNATDIDLVTATWNYTTINETTGQLEINDGGCGEMALFQTISETEHVYYCYSPVWSSGEYNVTFDVFDYVDGYGVYDKFATNTTTFDVEFGVAEVYNVMYNGLPAQALVLKNQTFNISADIHIREGDVWGLNISIESGNPAIINTSSFPVQQLGNRKNDNSTWVVWENVYANNTGLVNLKIKAIPANGTPTTRDKYPQIVDVLVDVKNSTINITEEQFLQVMLAGNFSYANYVNLTIANEFGLTTNSLNYDFYTVDGEDCYELEGDSKNVALLSYGATASSTGGDNPPDYPNATIDNNTGTRWIGTTYSGGSAPVEINITFNKTYSLKNVKLLWDDANGNANVSVYYYVQTIFKLGPDGPEPVLERILVASGVNPPNTTNTSIFEKTQGKVEKIQIVQNKSGEWLNIYSIEAHTAPLTDDVPDCIIYNFSYFPPRSGTYKITPETILDESTTKRTDASSFLVNFGRPALMSHGQDIMLVNNNYTYMPEIKAVIGDIYNITVNLTIGNKTVLNYSAGENMSKNIPCLYFEDIAEGISWDLNATELGTTGINMTINSTSLEGMFLLNETNISVILEDNTPPTVNDFWFLYNTTNKTNLKTDFIIYANITDEGTYVQNATANVAGPSGEFNKTVTSKISDDLWKITLSNNLNETGNYTVKIFAYDLGDNINWSGEVSGPANLSFNVTDVYHFGSPEHTIYNRGENVEINLRDINNNTVTNANWTVNITKYYKNETSERGGGIYADDYSYEIKTNDTEGNYNIFANATKDGNYITGGHNMSFNVSKTLTILFNYSFLSEYNPSATFGLVKASLYNARNEVLNSTSVTNLWLYYTGAEYTMPFYAPDSLYRYDNVLTSSSTAGASIPLIVNVTYNNNTGEATTIIKTNAGGTIPPPGGGGSTSSPSIGGFAPMVTPENKTPEINFNYTIENTERTITQGVADSIMATIANTGELPIAVSTKTSDTPLNITIDENFELAVGADKSFRILVYANLSIEPRTYYADITLYNENYNIEKTRTLKIKVDKNSEQINLESIKTSLKDLNEELDSFSAAGVNTSSLKEKTGKIADYIIEAEQAIEYDNYPDLKAANIEADNLIRQVWAETIPLRTTKFIYENKWELIYAGLVSLISIYLLLYLILPYAKISSKIRKLTRQEKIIVTTRKSTEKKYFMRQMNEVTFNKIMAEEEEKLLKLKSEVAKLTQERALLRHFKIRELRHLEDEKKKDKKRVEKEKELKEKSKRKMSDVILEHDMKKKSIFKKLFKKKKRKEFVFETNTKELKKTPKNIPKKQNEKIKESFFKRLFRKKPNPKIPPKQITTNPFKTVPTPPEVPKTEPASVPQQQTKEPAHDSSIFEKEKTIYSTNTNNLADDLMEIKRKIKDMKDIQ